MKQVAIIALLNSKNELLLQLRDNKPEIIYPNHWGFVGGSIEEGESEIEGLKREILEEINLEIEPLKKIGQFPLIGKNILNHVFLGELELPAEQIKIGEGQQVKFFSFEEMKKLRVPEPLMGFLIENKTKLFEKRNSALENNNDFKS